MLIIDTLKKYLNLNKPLRILDIGSGIGGYVYELSKLENLQIISLDKNPLSIAIKNYREIVQSSPKINLKNVLHKKAKVVFNSKNVAVIEGDITNAPFENEAFDVIIASGVIEHVRDQKAMVYECHRILKKGGIFFLSFPPFYSPTGGHSISPLHYLPGKLPFILYRKMHVKDHESFVYYGLYKTTLRSVKRLARGKFRIIDINPRLFSFLKPLLKIPLFNEVISHHVEFILTK